MLMRRMRKRNRRMRAMVVTGKIIKTRIGTITRKLKLSEKEWTQFIFNEIITFVQI
jgi:hypothetical protein